MQEINGNLFDFCDREGCAICIPTNGALKKTGILVMGRGLALEAKLKFPELPTILGERVRELGNRVYYIPELRVFSFPTKHHWMNRKSDLKLIQKSALELNELSEKLPELKAIYLPIVGSGLGNLEWFNVKDAIAPILSGDRFVVVRQGFDLKLNPEIKMRSLSVTNNSDD